MRDTIIIHQKEKYVKRIMNQSALDLWADAQANAVRASLAARRPGIERAERLRLYALVAKHGKIATALWRKMST